MAVFNAKIPSISDKPIALYHPNLPEDRDPVVHLTDEEREAFLIREWNLDWQDPSRDEPRDPEYPEEPPLHELFDQRYPNNISILDRPRRVQDGTLELITPLGLILLKRIWMLSILTAEKHNHHWPMRGWEPFLDEDWDWFSPLPPWTANEKELASLEEPVRSENKARFAQLELMVRNYMAENKLEFSTKVG